MINYHNKRFRPIVNSENGEVDHQTEFLYQQKDSLVYCQYTGGKIKYGHLIAQVLPNGCLNMRYHQINVRGELMTGICFSTPEILSNGKIRLFEKWQWTSGDGSSGESILEEI